MAVVRATDALDLRVPRDSSVTGFDDLAGAKDYCPPLATVTQSFEEMGRLAVRRLLSLGDKTLSGKTPGDHTLADGATGEQNEWTLPTHLIVRGYTAAL